MSATYEQIDIESLTEEQRKLLLEKLIRSLSGGTRDLAEMLGIDPCPDLPAGTEEILAREEEEYRRTGIKGRSWEEVRDSLGKEQK